MSMHGITLTHVCRHPTAASRPSPSGTVTRLSHPDFQILKWSQKDLDATSERARTLGAPLIEGHALYKGLQQTYTRQKVVNAQGYYY